MLNKIQSEVIVVFVCRVDLGTSDPLALDVFINGFISVSSE